MSPEKELVETCPHSGGESLIDRSIPSLGRKICSGLVFVSQTKIKLRPSKKESIFCLRPAVFGTWTFIYVSSSTSKVAYFLRSWLGMDTPSVEALFVPIFIEILAL